MNHDHAMAQLDGAIGRTSVRFKDEDSLKSEIVTLQRRIARAVKSTSLSEQRRAERLSEILKSRMEAYTELLEKAIEKHTPKPVPTDAEIDAMTVADEESRRGPTPEEIAAIMPEALAGLKNKKFEVDIEDIVNEEKAKMTSLPLPEFVPPAVG